MDETLAHMIRRLTDTVIDLNLSVMALRDGSVNTLDSRLNNLQKRTQDLHFLVRDLTEELNKN